MELYRIWWITKTWIDFKWNQIVRNQSMWTEAKRRSRLGVWKTYNSFSNLLNVEILSPFLNFLFLVDFPLVLLLPNAEIHFGVWQQLQYFPFFLSHLFMIKVPISWFIFFLTLLKILLVSWENWEKYKLNSCLVHEKMEENIRQSRNF